VLRNGWVRSNPRVHVYRSTRQITTDIIAEGEEQNINFQRRETVHSDLADQFCPLAACHQHFRSRQRSQCNTNKKDKTHTMLWKATYYLFDGLSDGNETKNYSSPVRDSSCTATVDAWYIEPSPSPSTQFHLRSPVIEDSKIRWNCDRNTVFFRLKQKKRMIHKAYFQKMIDQKGTSICEGVLWFMIQRLDTYVQFTYSIMFTTENFLFKRAQLCWLLTIINRSIERIDWS
jgi:hypothetical protein